MSRSSISTRTLAHVGLFAAVLAVLSQLAIPLPSGVPATLQTFAVALAGYTLGGKKSIGAVLVYLLLGAVGLPIFANFKAGAAVLFGVTGGFLWSFILFAFLCGVATDLRLNTPSAWALGLTGLALVHFFGLIQFSFITHTPPAKAFFLCSLPFILKDVISVAAAHACGRVLCKRLPL